MTSVRLTVPSYPYRFDLLLEFAKRIAFPARMVVDGAILWRYTDGLLRSYQELNGSIQIRGDGLKAENGERTRRSAKHILGSGRDLSDFYAIASADPRLWQVVEPLVGLPLFCTETVFEALTTLIIEQHITWKNALRSQQTLMQIFHEGALVGRGRVYKFPSPRQLAEASLEQLKPLKITNGRVNLIIDIAKSVGQGDLDLESFRWKTPREAYEQLMKIKGVGHWTASNVVARALGHYPYVSQNDVALQAAVKHYFFADEGVKSGDKVDETLGKYGDYAGLAGHFVLLCWVLDRYPPVSM